MSAERPELPQEPAEGEEEVGAPGADRPGDDGKATESTGDEAKPSGHPEEVAEGSEEDEEAPGAERAGDGN